METQKYLQLSKLSKTQFRRYTGTTTFVFEIMVVILKEYERQVKGEMGRPNNLSSEDQVLMLLEYYRENRTFFHLGTSYGVSESNAQRNIVKIENILIGSGYFKLLGKKVLLSDKNLKTILIDVTECPAYRPKKKSEISVK
jgi:Helix-turn-helix of DDE superfamily endonuclease